MCDFFLWIIYAFYLHRNIDSYTWHVLFTCRPNDSRMVMALGDTYEKLERLQEAKKCYWKAHSIGDIEGQALVKLAKWAIHLNFTVYNYMINNATVTRTFRTTRIFFFLRFDGQHIELFPSYFRPASHWKTEQLCLRYLSFFNFYFFNLGCTKSYRSTIKLRLHTQNLSTKLRDWEE